MSTNIFRNAYVDLKDKVKMNSVTRSKDRVLPRFFIQQEETKKPNKQRAIWKIKAGVIEGDTDFPGLVC